VVADAHPKLPLWLKLLAGMCVVLCAAFAVSVIPGVRHGEVAFWDTWVYDAVSVVSTLVCFGRAAIRRAERAAWIAIGLALLTSTAGDITWSVLAAGGGDPGQPSLADIPWVGFYPLGYAGLAMLVRSRVTAAQTTSWLDGLVSGLALASVVAAVAWDTIASGATGGPLAVATALAYPVGDLLVMVLVLGAFALTGWRPDRGLMLIGAGLLVWCAADTVYLFETARGTYATGGPIDLLWPLGMTLMALGALQRATARERVPHWTGVAMPTLSACAAGAVLVTGALGHGHDLGVALAAGAVLAGVARTVVGLRANVALAATRALANTDDLTGLPNRRALFARLQEGVEAGRPFGVVVFDLDHFKLINDTLGHAAGDEALRRLSLRLAEQLRPADLLVRLGGDEFALVVEDARDERAVHTIAERLVRSLDRPLSLTSGSATIGASFGAALHPDDATSVSELLEAADAAMYRAKRLPGRRAPHHGAELERALEAGELELHLQPVIHPPSQAMVAAEALLRWRHPQHGLLAAGEFLPELGDARVQRAITDRVVAHALKLRDVAGVPIAVHLFPADLRDDALAERLDNADGLELEIGPLAEPERAAELLEAITLPVTLERPGPTMLAHLKTLPIRRVKLDARFAATPDPRDQDALDAIVALAAAYGAEIAAWRVETEHALTLLRARGIARAQGYAIAAPMPPSLLGHWAVRTLVPR
jgi:diguanylate cyclase